MRADARMMAAEAKERIVAEQSELYRSVARAYRDAQAGGACESDCWSEAAEAVLSAHPFLLDQEAERLARRIVSKFLELYPEWFSG